MANEKFKVKFGLAVGDTAATIDGTTGDIVTNGDLILGGKNIFPGATDDIIQIENNTTTTNDFFPALALKTTTTGTPAVGLGPALMFVGQTGASNFENAGYIAVESTDITSGSEDFEMRFGLMTGGATWATKLTLNSLGNLTTVGNLDVQGGTVTDSTGALSITTGASNGDITLDPNGTGNIVLTLANGGNLTNSRNYVYGAIRNATTATNGDVWSLLAGAGPNYRGVSIDNSVDTTKRPGYILRTYGSGLGGAPRGAFFSEFARGTAASPSNLTSGDRLAEFLSGGYVVGGGTSAVTGWVTDSVANFPALMRFVPAENWDDGLNKVGARCQIILQPPSTPFTGGSTVTVLNAGTDFTRFTSDAYEFKNKSGSNNLTIDVNGNAVLTGDLRINGNDIQASDGNTNITLTSNTLTTLAGNLTVSGTGTSTIGGDLRINGNDIQASDGATNITLTSNTLTSFAGDIRVNGGDIQNPGGTSAITLTSSNTITTITGDQINIGNNSGTGGARLGMTGTGSISGAYVDIGDVNIAQMSSSWQSAFSPGFKYTGLMSDSTLTGLGSYFEMSSRWKANAGTSTFSTPLTGWGLGRFGFSADNSTTNTSQVNSGAMQAKATENWSSTATGSSLVFTANKAGVANVGLEVLQMSPENTYMNADTIVLSNSATTVNYLNLDSDSATFANPVQFPNKTAAQWNAITGQVGMQVCVNNSPVNAGKMAYWDTTNARWSYVDSNLAV